MAMRFDATVKELALVDPAGFLSAFDPAGGAAVKLLNVDLSTVTTSADVVFGVGEPLSEIVHLDAQAGADADLHENVLAYNALLHRRYKVPVHSIVVLLRPQAQHYHVSGTIAYAPRADRGGMAFRYELVRMWEQPVEAFLQGHLGLTPLAPLCRLPDDVPPRDALLGVIRQLVQRVEHEAPPEQRKKLLTAAYLLTGLRIARDAARDIFLGVTTMHESDTYQAILDEGEVRGLHEMALFLGIKRFGEPDSATRERILAISEPEPLKRMIKQILDVESWDEMLRSE